MRRIKLGAGVLLGVAGRLGVAEGGEGVHAVDDAGVFQGVPEGLVLGLDGVVALGVHGAYEGDAAAHLGDAI